MFNNFVSNFQSLWRSRTFCADGYEVEKCANFKSDGRPAEADPACYEANPKTPPEACPAPVFQPKPALPGSISVITPKANRLPSGPGPRASNRRRPSLGRRPAAGCEYRGAAATAPVLR